MSRLIILFVLVLAATAVQATTTHVPSEQSTIQSGSDVIVDGDTALVAPGTYAENVYFSGDRQLYSIEAL